MHSPNAKPDSNFIRFAKLTGRPGHARRWPNVMAYSYIPTVRKEFQCGSGKLSRSFPFGFLLIGRCGYG